MKYLKETCLVIILMLPLKFYAAPHEPSPAGGGWLELSPKLPLVQTEKPWFPDYPGPLTIEAWVYIDRPPSVRDVMSLATGSRAAFSIVGQTDRFTCAIVGDGYTASPAIVTRGIEGGSGKISGTLPTGRWVYYVAIIDGGSTVGCGGSISGLIPGGHLTSANEPLLVGGVPVLKDSGLKAMPASGMYIDELRISRVVRYDVGAYNVPASAFAADDDTLGLYHFDGNSTERYEDASPHKIPLIRVKKQTESKSNQ